MRFISVFKTIEEKRRYEKPRPLEVLSQYKDQEDVFISFTSSFNTKLGSYKSASNRGVKLGINPQSSFGTPLGIYTYPVKAMWKDIENYTIPYQKDAPNIFVLKPKNNESVAYASKYTEQDLSKDIEGLSYIVSDFLKVHGHKLSYNDGGGEGKSRKEFETYTADDFQNPDILQKVTESDLRYMYKRVGEEYMRFPLQKFWSLTREIASRYKLFLPGVRVPVLWSSIMFKFYDGIVDDLGKGFIHSNEPMQAVFFNSSVIQALDLIRRAETRYPGNDWKPRKEIDEGTEKSFKTYTKFKKVLNETDNGDKIFNALFTLMEDLKDINPQNDEKLAGIYGKIMQNIAHKEKFLDVVFKYGPKYKDDPRFRDYMKNGMAYSSRLIRNDYLAKNYNKIVDFAVDILGSDKDHIVSVDNDLEGFAKKILTRLIKFKFQDYRAYDIDPVGTVTPLKNTLNSISLRILKKALPHVHTVNDMVNVIGGVENISQAVSFMNNSIRHDTKGKVYLPTGTSNARSQYPSIEHVTNLFGVIFKNKPNMLLQLTTTPANGTLISGIHHTTRDLLFLYKTYIDVTETNYRNYHESWADAYASMTEMAFNILTSLLDRDRRSLLGEDGRSMIEDMETIMLLRYEKIKYIYNSPPVPKDDNHDRKQEKVSTNEYTGYFWRQYIKAKIKTYNGRAAATSHIRNSPFADKDLSKFAIDKTLEYSEEEAKKQSK